MSLTPAHEPPTTALRHAAQSAWDRRRRAAWMDYLRVTGEAARVEYDGAEANAWEQLQRRLRRNDELLTQQLTGVSYR